MTYWESGKAVFNMFQHRGFDAIINDNIIGAHGAQHTAQHTAQHMTQHTTQHKC